MRYLLSLLLLPLMIICNCSSKELEKSNAALADSAVFPQAYNKEERCFYVRNEIEISAKPEVVWNVLTDALHWSEWYQGAKNVTLLDSTQTQLTFNSVIKWETMGLSFISTIKEFEPYKLLAWESYKSSLQGYHVWLIIPKGDGCVVITEEAQLGWLTFFEKIFQPNALRELHDEWLAGIKRRAEAKQ